MNTIVKMKFGSHLYGTDTHDSDLDYRGVFLPDMRDIYLGRIPKVIKETTSPSNLVKNEAGDIDTQMYSLHYFLKLACAGETGAIDMLHAPMSMVSDNRTIVETSDIWCQINFNRSRFYTKNLKAFVGYARKQASKYGIKGSRLDNIATFLEFLKGFDNGAMRLVDIWDVLPTGEHIFKDTEPRQGNKYRMYEVCGRKVQETQEIDYVFEIFDKLYGNYGARAKLAKENKGIDWKAMSHAIRAGYQLRQIYTEGDITFPLREANIILKCKLGEMDFTTEAAPLLDELIENCELRAAASDYPEKVDCKYWDDFIVNCMENA